MALTTKSAGALIEGGTQRASETTTRVRFLRNRVASGARYVRGDVANIGAADAEILLRMGVVACRCSLRRAVGVAFELACALDLLKSNVESGSR